MKGAPRSEEFDDVYFSAENGLAETQHVFIAGNNLPGAWAEKPRFTIAEAGFGTGLNFLVAWKLFRQTAAADQRMDFVSVEKFPLSMPQITQALGPWADELAEELEALAMFYPLPIPGFHRLFLDGRTTLTLVFDDINQALPEIEAQVDCWFLDGFKPSSNPDMWTDTVFENMRRLSIKGASVATFTAAGFVRRGLESAGFSMEKVPGFGQKREMLTGVKP